MSYSAGEALFLTQLQAMSQFDSGNSARGKWNILNSGNSSQYAILKQGTRARRKISPTKRYEVHQTIIQLWQRYVDDGTSYTNLLALIDAVVAALDPYRIMGDTTGGVIQANITSVGEILVGPAPTGGGDGPLWLYCELVGEWHEETTINYAE